MKRKYDVYHVVYVSCSVVQLKVSSNYRNNYGIQKVYHRVYL